METINLPHLDSHPLQIGLFKDVTNAAHLRAQLLAGNQDFEYAFLDAAMISSRTQVLAACFRAVNDSIQNRLKTRNVHSEIVFALSPNNNIAESFRRFGVQDSTTSVVAIKVSPDATAVAQHLGAEIQGQLLPFSDVNLSSLTDESRVRKVYRWDQASKPSKGVTTNGNSKGNQFRKEEVEAFIVGSIALKESELYMVTLFRAKMYPGLCGMDRLFLHEPPTTIDHSICFNGGIEYLAKN